MIPVTIFNNQKIALFGLGDSGIASAQALIAGGAQVIAFDDDTHACERARESGITITDLRQIDWQTIGALILTPGVPLTHPVPHWAARLASAAGVEIIGDIELFVRERAASMARLKLDEEDCPLIAITGTNGKSTTTTLIAHILGATGRDVAMGGNIGLPILQLEPVAKGRHYVIECSSYQIDLSPHLCPSIAILLNLTPDHIDRHGTFENYAKVKKQLVTSARTAIISLDDEPCRAIAEEVKASNQTIISISSQKSSDAVWFAEDNIIYRQTGDGHEKGHEFVTSLGGITSLRGRHNVQNACAALASCTSLGVDMHKAAATLPSFKGLAHRMEKVGQRGHVLFINDSKATNAEACAWALSSFDTIYWIAGGVAKQGGIESLKPFFNKIRHAYLIGAAAEDFRQTIGEDTRVTMSNTLAQATIQAARDAMADNNSGEVAVLLSPACASFDQFINYAARGDAFCQLVGDLLME